MKFQRFLACSALYLCCAFIVLGLQCSWLCFGARQVVKNLSAMCVLGFWAFPMDKGCQTELRAELPSSVRTETIWAGEVTAFGMLEMQGKSPLWHNSICFYLFLPFIFHRALVAACCSSCLDLPLGFLGTGDAPPLVFGDAPLPLAGSMVCSPTVTGDGNLQLHQGLAFHPFPRRAASAFWCAWGGEITPKPAELCGCVFCMILVQSNALHLYFRVSLLLFSLMSHLWKLWVLHLSGALLWDPVQVPLKPVECFASMEAFSIGSRRGESGIGVTEPVKGELVGASEK